MLEEASISFIKFNRLVPVVFVILQKGILY